MRFVCNLQDISFETQTDNKAKHFYDLNTPRAVRIQMIECLEICPSIVLYNFRQRNRINLLKLVS